MSKFADDMRLAMRRYEQQGITCHPMTGEELASYDNSRPQQPKLEYVQLPLAERFKQMRRVKRLVKDKEMSVRDACDKVGIGYANYKCVCSAEKKGLKKRP